MKIISLKATTVEENFKEFLKNITSKQSGGCDYKLLLAPDNQK